MRSAIARLQGLVLQRSFQEQQQVAHLSAVLPQLSDLQQLAAAALGGTCNSSSSSSWTGQSAGCASVRYMAGRTHKLSLKKANNKASWKAVAPYLKQQQQPDQDALQQRQGELIQSAIPSLPVLEEPVLYQRIGRITGPYSVGAQPCFAVMESGGSQWKVTADDVIFHNKIPGAHVNDVLEFNKVLLLGTREDTTIGRPFVPGASVVAAVEEVFKDSKVYVFKKKVRKRYSKLQGHRSHITTLRILEVRQPRAKAAALASDQQAAAAVAAPPVTNVAPLGVEPSQPLAVSEKRTPYEMKSRRRNSKRPAAAAPASAEAEAGAEAAAAEPVGEQDAGVQAQTPGRQRLPLHAVGDGRQHGPPAVLNAMGVPKARSNAH